MNQQPPTSNQTVTLQNWLSGPKEIDIQKLEQSIATTINTELNSGKLKANDVVYVTALPIPGAQKDLILNDELVERLRGLCKLWEVQLKPPTSISSHRKIVGPVIVMVKKAIYPVMQFFLKDVLRRQRDFNAATVSFLADLAGYVEQSRK